jgi:hypothetical protein
VKKERLLGYKMTEKGKREEIEWRETRANPQEQVR